MEITRDSNAKGLAARALGDLFKKFRSAPVLFLSSGGSSLSLLEQVDIVIFSPNITCGVIDERLSADPAINNFLQLRGRLFGATALNWVDSVLQAGDSLVDMADRIDSSWRAWRKDNPNGKITATIGVGVDGHVAGIMPNIDLKIFDNKWVAGYDAGPANKFPLRITATFEFLRSHVDFAIVYISGEEKRRALERVLADSGSLAETPARILGEMKNAKIFTDIS